MPVNTLSQIPETAPAPAVPSGADWIAPGCAVLLIASLFLPWYTLRISAAGTALPLNLASTAPQWMGNTSWALAAISLVIIAATAASSPRSPLHGELPSVPRELTVIWPAVAVMLIVYRLIQPPPLPGSGIEYALNGTPSVGPFVGLLLAVVMTVAVYRHPRG